MNWQIDAFDSGSLQLADIANLFRMSRQYFLPYLPDLHSASEDLEYFRNEVSVSNQIYLAKQNDELIGFIAFSSDMVSHLYLLPGFEGKGIGKALLEKAKENSVELKLWVFQRNDRAVQFYQSNGFKVVKKTDGSSNEEKEPDFLMQWKQK